MEKITVGIDVSKDRFDVAVRPSGETLVSSETPTCPLRSWHPSENFARARRRPIIEMGTD